MIRRSSADRPGRHLLSTSAVLAGAAVLAVAPTSAAGAAAKGCGNASASYIGVDGGASVRITLVRGVGCSEAKRLVRQCIQRQRVKGWQAGADASRTPTREMLLRGSRRIEWIGVAGGSATCTADAVEEASSENS